MKRKSVKKTKKPVKKAALRKKPATKKKAVKKSAPKKIAESKAPTILLVADKTSPLVYMDFALKVGAIADPKGKEGLASITLSMLLRGTKRMSSQDFHASIDRLGAEIHLGKTKESLRVYGVVLKDHLSTFLELFREALTEPRFDPAEFAKLQAQFKSSLLDELGSDDEIADRRFQEHLLWGHPYGKMTSGGLETIENITLDDVKDFYSKNFAAGGAVFSAMGAFQPPKMRAAFQAIAKALPAQGFVRQTVEAPVFATGRTLLLLHKPGRTQSQIVIGAPGISFHNTRYTAMQLANHVFGGGSFSARLMKEVREKRGWSYGAYAWYRSGRQPLCMSLQTVPATKDTVPALKLMMELLEAYAKKGLTKQEFAFAKESLLNQAAFQQDTPRKKLDNKVSELLLELPKGYYDGYSRRLAKLNLPIIQAAIRQQVNHKDLFVVVLGDADALEKDLKRLKWNRVIRRNFDEAPQAL